MMSKKERLQKYIKEIDEEIKLCKEVKRVKALKLAMLEAHDRKFEDNQDKLNYIHQRVDDLMGELKWQS